MLHLVKQPFRVNQLLKQTNVFKSSLETIKTASNITLSSQCSQKQLRHYSTSGENKPSFEIINDMKSFLELKNKTDMKVSNEQWLELLRNRANGGLPSHMNFEIVSINDEVVVAQMKVQDHHMAANGYIHAASLITLADTTCGFGCFTKLPKGSNGFTTIELKSNFLGTSKAGALLKCEARMVHGGRSTQVWDATITEPLKNQTLALFRCTEMILYPKPTTTK